MVTLSSGEKHCNFVYFEHMSLAQCASGINFGNETCDKTPTPHFSGNFSMFPGVTHRIPWENTYKPVRMTKMWQKFTF